MSSKRNINSVKDDSANMSININNKEDYYFHKKKCANEMSIVYGAGSIAKQRYFDWGKIDYFVDKRATEIKNIGGIPCILPEELGKLESDLCILISVNNVHVYQEICNELSSLDINAVIFNLFDNPAFDAFDYPSKEQYMKKDSLIIRIVCGHDGWIFQKFAEKLREELTKLGQIATISEVPDPDADINHYISYGRLTLFSTNYVGKQTTMITHIDSVMKKELVSFQADHDVLGICMSEDTMNKLVTWGVKRESLCYVNPAHDQIMQPRKIVLGITNRCYGAYDMRKRDNLIYEVLKKVNPNLFELKIMGSGWDDIVEDIKKLGIQVTYYNDFDREKYIQLMPSLDYWIYYGFDEGAMGYLDAMAAGVKTIVTPQGYHLDTTEKPTYFCETIDDFVGVMLKIQNKIEKRIASVAGWTWKNYAKKHLEIWEYLLKSKPLKEIYVHQNEYKDGIYSMLLSNNEIGD